MTDDRPWLRMRDAVVLLAPLVLLVAWSANLRYGFTTASPAMAAPAEHVPFAREVVDAADLGADCKALADIDGDGRLDPVVADDSGTPLQWYDAAGTGHVIDDRSVFTTDMEVGDVDGDGDPDVIVPDYVAQTVLWYANPRIGGGDWTPTTLGAGLAHDVDAGDVDADGDLDVAVRGHDGATVVFLQDSPTRWRAVDIAAPSGEGVALGDVDGDGDLDVVEGGYWLEAPDEPATGSWRSHPFADGWPARVSVQVADLSGDGRLDVVLAASESRGRMVWYEQPPGGEGRWTAHEMAASLDFVHDFQIADYDLDGDLDVAFAEMHTSTHKRVGLLLQVDASTWHAQTLATTGSHNISAGDVDGDGDVDLLGANHDGRSPLELWVNLRADRLANWTPHVVDAARPATAVFIDSADVDGDGDRDLVTGAWWYENHGRDAGDWTRHDIGDPLHQTATVFDYDGDGDVDVLGTRGEGATPNASFVWARNDGHGRFAVFDNIEQAQGDFLGGAVAARFTPDGPVATALSWHDPEVGVQMLTTPDDPTAQPWRWRELSPSSQTNGIDAGDLDDDGDLDLLLGTRWLRNDGGDWTSQRLTDMAGAPDRPVLADVDGDGDDDAVVGFEVISQPGPLVWYERPARVTGDEVWRTHRIATVTGPMSVGVADMDEDGDLDVVVGEHDVDHPERARMLVVENADGRGTAWREHVVATGDEHHDGAHVTDIDGDGDLDVASIGWTHPRVLLYENTAVRR